MNFYTNETCTKGVIVKSDYVEITNFVFVLDISASMRTFTKDSWKKLSHLYKPTDFNMTLDDLLSRWVSLKDENREYINKYVPLYIAYKTYIYAKKQIDTFYSSKINKHNLITFESSVREHNNNTPKYEDICYGCGTNFEDMTKILTAYLHDNKRSFIILLTDGQSSVLPSTLRYLQGTLQFTNSVMSVVGFTDSINEDLLKQYVSSDGEYDKILNVEEIETVIDRILNKFTDQIDNLIVSIDEKTMPVKMVNGVSEVIELSTQPKNVVCNENNHKRTEVSIAVDEVIVSQQDYVAKWNEYIDTCLQYNDVLHAETEHYKTIPDELNVVLSIDSSKTVFDKIINNDLDESTNEQCSLNKNTELKDTLLKLKMYRKYFEQEDFAQKCDQGKISVKDKVKFFTGAMNN